MAGERAEALLHGIRPESKILELGPSHAPLAPRAEGWNVTVVDYASREALIEKYRNDPTVNISNIEEVDHVWRGGPLHETVPADQLGSFDVLIASHVIEHIPDPVAFMQSAEQLLHPEHGVLVLAVPDKRWCFDYFKQISTTGQMLEAHRQRAQRHNAATRFDFSAYFACDGVRSGWGREKLPDLRLLDTLENAYQNFRDWSPDPDAPYVDCHAWHFTPSSFELLILELGAVGLLDWHISWLSPRPAVEFLTQMKRGRQWFASTAEREQRRAELLKQMLLDVREQADWLLNTTMTAAPPAAASAGGGFDDAARQQLQQVAATVAALHQAGPPRADCGFDDGAREQLRQVAETAAMTRAALRPGRAVWQGILPMRRAVARLRGRA